MTKYTDATILRSVTILSNAGIDATTIALIAATQNRTTVAPKAIAPEAGFFAEPSIAAGPSKAKAPKAKAAKRSTPRNPTTDAADNNRRDWRDGKPSKMQIGRNMRTLASINRLEDELGYRLSTHQSLNGGKAAKFNAGDYSAHYQNNLAPTLASLKAELDA